MLLGAYAKIRWIKYAAACRANVLSSDNYSWCEHKNPFYLSIPHKILILIMVVNND